jgi:hypothetical protein
LIELDERNSLDRDAKARVAAFAKNISSVDMTATALRDTGLLNITKLGILEAVVCHLQKGRPMFSERLDSGENAYVLKECITEAGIIYIKVKFYRLRGTEKMLVISAHPNRRW